MSSRVSTVLRDGFSFPEGLRWRDGRLWVSDQTTGAVQTVTEDGQLEHVVDVPGGASGLGWLPGGDLLVVAMENRQLLRVGAATGELAVHARLTGVPGVRLNDMVVDETGRAYVGDFGFDPTAFVAQFGAEALTDGRAPTSVLARVEPDGSVHLAADGLHFPNGCVITADGATLIVAETFGRRLTALHRSATGELSDRYTWATLDAMPDGICADVEGAIWVADVGGARCLRIAPAGRGRPARVADEVTTGGSAYSCVLGGEDGRTLFIATGHRGAGGPRGRIETARVDVPAAPPTA